MPRSKVEMSLIGDARDRARTFTRRKAGLVKKARELAELCDIDVAVVCAGPDGAAPVVWESDPGAVIDRYRRLPAEKRAEHTHAGYVNGELSKERGRLAKVRSEGAKALACPGEAELEGMDLEELLASIDAALLATDERRKALAASGAGDGQLGQWPSDAIVPAGQGDPPFLVGDDLDGLEAWVDELMRDDDVEPLPLNATAMQPASGVQYIDDGDDDVDMGGNHQWQAQMPPGNDEYGHGQFPWHTYQPDTAISYPDDGFQLPDNDYVDMDGYSHMDMDGYSNMPVPSNANAYDGWHDQGLWRADEPSSNAIVPAAHPPLDIAGNPVYMPLEHEHPSMGVDSFMDVGGHEDETWCLADCFQGQEAGQDFGAEPLLYLSDLAQDTRYYDIQAGSGSSDRDQLFAQSDSGFGTLQFSSSSEQCRSDMGHQDQDPGVQHFWVMEGSPDSTDVATVSKRATSANLLGSVYGNNGGLYQPWVTVQQ